MNCRTLLIFAMSLALVDRAAAHPGHEHEHDESASGLRAWHEASGEFELQASFVAATDGLVQLRKSDGTLLSIELARLSERDRTWIEERCAELRRLNEGDLLALADGDPIPVTDKPAPLIHQHFLPFAKRLKLRWDADYYYVGSNGMPDHPMMVGIRAWQQQVPLPQKYFDANAWRIPLHPKPAKQPMTAKGNFLRGAIALAANGVPIFNPLNNRGDDAFLFGELDEYGGHCGRADDYHYHIAPLHLQKQVGKTNPIGYALDGYPIYGLNEPDGSQVVGLDWLNGHKDVHGNYHYHGTKTYPYLNGGFYGEVVERDGQVDPQPRAQPVREGLPPLRGAKIVGFTSPQPNSYLLTYEQDGRKGTVGYTIAETGSVAFKFVDTSGKTTTETYTPRGGGENRPPRPGEGNRPPRPGQDGRPPRPGEENRPPRPGDDDRPPRRDEVQIPDAEMTTLGRTDIAKLSVTCSAMQPGENYPTEFTCDGAGISPPVEWSGGPAGTKFYALNIWHTPGPGDVKSYWVVYNIPASTTKLPKNARSIGQVGINDKRRNEYDPMCSKGPGAKSYHITVYALSKELTPAPNTADRAKLLDAVKAAALAEGTFTYRYERRKQN